MGVRVRQPAHRHGTLLCVRFRAEDGNVCAGFGQVSGDDAVYLAEADDSYRFPLSYFARLHSMPALGFGRSGRGQERYERLRRLRLTRRDGDAGGEHCLQRDRRR